MEPERPQYTMLWQLGSFSSFYPSCFCKKASVDHICPVSHRKGMCRGQDNVQKEGRKEKGGRKKGGRRERGREGEKRREGRKRGRKGKERKGEEREAWQLERRS